jgi:serine/threonine protein kinase
VNPSPPAHRHAHAIGSNREQSVIDEGQLIAGHYRLLERIGSGSMGVVWRARDERLERVVAVKQLLTQTGLTDEQKEDARRRALREARIAARLHHPNAIVVFDVAEQDGDPCLVMEYMASMSMAAILAERGSMAAADVAAVGSQIASALAAAHASGIVHRDVKPANILINDAGVAKITDFGIARAAGDVTVTQTGMFAGTPAYLAPEVARGQEPTSASDVFSFGASLYDAVEGGPPFPERQNQLALLRLVAEGKVQPPRQAGVLTALLMQLLRAEPDERPTMSQASRMLAELATDRTPRPLATVGHTQPTVPDLRLPDAEPAARTEQAPVPLPPLVLGDRPAAYRPTTASTPVDRKPVDRRLVFIAAGAAVIVLVAVGLALLLKSGGAPTHQAGGATGTATTSATSRPTTQTGGTSLVSTPPAVGGAPTSGTIGYSAAGLLVVNYFSRLADTAGRWANLTPGAQAAFGGLSGFQQYWGQFSQLSSAHAIGVTTNTDGSVNVPIDVTYTTGTGASTATHTTHEELRVVQENGVLLIDTLAK